MVRTEGALFAVHSHETGMVAGGENGGLVHWTPNNTRILAGHEGGAYELAGPYSGGADGRLLHWPTQQVLGAVPGRVRCCAQTDSGWVVGTHEGELHHLKMGWSQKLHEGSLRAFGGLRSRSGRFCCASMHTKVRCTGFKPIPSAVGSRRRPVTEAWPFGTQTPWRWSSDWPNLRCLDIRGR